MKLTVECSWCHTPILRYPSQLKVSKNSYCCSTCRSAHLSKSQNPDGYRKHEHLSDYNRRMNANRMTSEVRAKLSDKRFGTGKCDTYLKKNGRHIHRSVAEAKLGRPLKPGEVVHHIDHNKKNNDPDNLMIFKSQSEHAQWHAREHQGGDAP